VVDAQLLDDVCGEDARGEGAPEDLVELRPEAADAELG
jgi:hypothetical protein